MSSEPVPGSAGRRIPLIRSRLFVEFNPKTASVVDRKMKIPFWAGRPPKEKLQIDIVLKGNAAERDASDVKRSQRPDDTEVLPPLG